MFLQEIIQHQVRTSNLGGNIVSFEDAILGGQLDDDIKTTGEFASDNINQTNIRSYDPTKGVFDPAFSRAVTLENRGEKSDPDPGDDKSIICTRRIVKQVWMIGQKL